MRGGITPKYPAREELSVFLHILYISLKLCAQIVIACIQIGSYEGCISKLTTCHPALVGSKAYKTLITFQ